MPASATPQAWLDGCVQAHHRLLEAVAPLTDQQARRESLLPGWTVGHLITHLARNADGHAGMIAAAARGQVEAQYPGGLEQRERDITAGYGRPAAELLADLQSATQRLEQNWAGMSVDAWATGLGRTTTGWRAIPHTVFLRWREVEVHLADLGLRELGCPSWDELSSAYIDAEYMEMTANLSRRVPEGKTILLVPGDRPSRAFGNGQEVQVIQATPPHLLQWLMGRGGDPAWPDLGAWG